MEINKVNNVYLVTAAKVYDVKEGQEVEIPSDIKLSLSNKVDNLTNQKDLLKILSVLVSTGMNLNTDVFLPSEILSVRNSGKDKPLNIEHNSNKIIGHMTRTYVSEKDGTIVPDDKTPKSNDFDIIAESVVYKYYFPEEAQEIRKRAEENKLFCSIEAFFTHFDFLVGSKVVKRNAETASVLDGILRQNGGNGVYEGKKVGRVLRNLIIGGIGLVKTPANPESLIKSVSFVKSEDVSNIENKIINDNVVGEVYELATASLQEDSMNKEIVEEIAEVIAAQKAVASITEAPKTEEPNSADPRISVLETTVRELKAKLDASEHKTEVSERTEILNKMGFSELFIVSTLSDKLFDNRESFNSFVKILTAAIKELAPKAQANTATVETPKTENKPEAPKAEVKVETPKTEAPKAETTKVAETPKVEEPKAEIKENKENNQEIESEDDNEDVISLEDLEVVDKEVKVETNTKNEPTNTEKFADIVQKLLVQRNDKWGKLALKK